MAKKTEQTKKGRSQKEDRATISVRNVSRTRWAAIQKKAREQGRFLWAVLDEMMDDYLKK